MCIFHVLVDLGTSRVIACKTGSGHILIYCRHMGDKRECFQWSVRKYYGAVSELLSYKHKNQFTY